MRAVVIDDDAGFLSGVRDALHSQNAEVIPCAETDRAPQCVLDNRPDIIILDVEMHGHPGARDVLQQLRANVATPQIPILVITALPFERGAIAIPMHRVRVMARPFDPPKLAALVRSMTGGEQGC